MSNTFMELMAKKKPSQLLSNKTANNLYQIVPTAAVNFEGLKMAQVENINDTKIKVTAYAPESGLMFSVPMDSRAPVSDHPDAKTQEDFTHSFKDSRIFTAEQLTTIARAQRKGSNDAEIWAAAKLIVRSIRGMKYNSQKTREKLIWEGFQGTMNLRVWNNGVESDLSITTNTRELTALLTTYGWNDLSSSSTADPVADIKAMQRSYTGKGSRLAKVKMNRVTFDSMMLTPKMRDEYKYTSRDIVNKGMDEVMISGVPMEIYNEGYTDDKQTFTNFISDGVIIGLGQENLDFEDAPIVTDYMCLNIDSKKEGDLEMLGLLYGAFFETKDGRNPKNTELFLSHAGSPIITNPQKVTYQMVFS